MNPDSVMSVGFSDTWVILNCFSCIDNDMCMSWHCHSCPSLASTFLGSRLLTVRCVIAAMVICALSHGVVREYLAAGGVVLTESQVQRMMGSAPVKLCCGLVQSFLIFQKHMSCQVSKVCDDTCVCSVCHLPR